MSKVYVIIEQCNVLPDDYLSYEKIVGVAESHAAAESMIDKLKENIITIAAANGIVKVIVDNGDKLWHDINDYEWRIEEYELIEES